MHFEWDPDKDAENQRKHGGAFVLAQHAFADPGRVIARDVRHGSQEDRYFCFGQVDGRVLTVRFTMRSGRVRIFGAAYWRQGKKKYHEKE